MRRYTPFAVIIVALAATVVVAATVHDAYPAIETTDLPTQQISGATTADALTVDTALSGRRQRTGGNTTVCVEVDFSGAAADTCVVSFIPWHVSGADAATRLPGIQTVTATAGTFTDAAGDNVAPAIFFEIPSGANYYEIRHAAPSAGNVDLTWVAYSASPQ